MSRWNCLNIRFIRLLLSVQIISLHPVQFIKDHNQVPKVRPFDMRKYIKIWWRQKFVIIGPLFLYWNWGQFRVNFKKWTLGFCIYNGRALAAPLKYGWFLCYHGKFLKDNQQKWRANFPVEGPKNVNLNGVF